MKKKTEKVTCIIPFYNEDACNVIKTLKIVLKVPEVNNVILVDDGSKSISTHDFLQLSIYNENNVKIMRLKKNYGKSFAIRFGLSVAKDENIILLDADLKNIDQDEISNAINKYILLDLDMLILRRVNSLPLVKLIRADTLLSGERILKKHHLSQILMSGVDGYQLEVATNQYFIDNNLYKKCYWSPSSAVNNYKFRKIKFFKGIFKDLKMYVNLIKYIGVRNYYNQFSNFCKLNV